MEECLLDQTNQIRSQSVEQFREANRHLWDVEVTQSDPGPLEIVMSATRVGDCLISVGSSNRTLLCSGQRSDEFWTISPVTGSGNNSRYCGQQLHEGDILLLDPGGDVYQQVAARHPQLAVSIPLSLAERILQSEYQTSAKELLESRRVKSDQRITTHLTRMIGKCLSEPGACNRETGAGVDLAGDIIALVQEAQQIRHAPSCLARRQRIVGRAEELIRERLDDPPSVTELCEATHASRRLLFYAFKELLGRSPRAHAKVLRLHAARRRILARKQERGVQQIGFDLGFWHPGQFAIDYARLFGESPSKTQLDSQRRG